MLSARTLTRLLQSYTTASVRRSEIEMFQKGSVPPVFTRPRTSSIRPLSEASETEFEDDYSDTDEYSGRRSEESV